MSPERLGQHFLTGEGWPERVLAAIARPPGAVWLEIGAGHGEMTTLLAHRAKQVVAIELDPPLARRLAETTASLANVRVVSGDVLELDLASLLPCAAERIHVYGNLPYYITSPILHRLFAIAERIASINIVVQLEVAERIASPPGRRDYGYLSVLAQFHAHPEIRMRIPPGAFLPPPKVFSALVSMELPGDGSTLGIADTVAFFEFVKLCFAQKRKTLWNNLRAAVGEERTRAALAAAGIQARTRAEELSVPQFAALYRALP
jgi:16S rRNA (adenine1518-N6/adenine1519-N6)-dimethyltransferase